ncbi:ATPase domain-containing protein [Geotalea sp. SG265]|uniref:ATPase domain-containing protein n=1 Tax=Geotalea sp. SG265 TaxID=2922867 RepID=UPI001FAE82DD|nr:ATPase domain-containing protein [Geotalea sp. SG265]
MGENLPAITPFGIAGLDDILQGGLTAGQVYLLSGLPGTGKTTFSLQFIAEGIRRGERCLYISVGGSGEEFVALAGTAGVFPDPELFSLHSVQISKEVLEGPEQRIFHPAETEPAGLISDLLTQVKRINPVRLVIDSLSDLRLLAEDVIGFRRLVLAMRMEFSDRKATVLLTNTMGPSEIDTHLETICHGVIRLEQVVRGYGPIRRRLLVLKVRGRPYRSGWHDFRILTGGIEVFPALVAGEHRQRVLAELLSSGNQQLDILFGGGVDRGTTIAVIGAAGTGKTTLLTQYAVAAANRGEHVAIYLFEESEESFRERARGLELGVDDLIDRRLLTLRKVDVAEFSIGEFTAILRQEVEAKGAQMVAIDTLSGFANAMQDDAYLVIQLHELLTYLCLRNVTTLVAIEQHGVFGSDVAHLKDISYLADSILLLRFFEHRGEIRRAISVVKKRKGRHELTIRELRITDRGLAIGEPLKDMQGVLTGVPVLAR